MSVGGFFAYVFCREKVLHVIWDGEVFGESYEGWFLLRSLVDALFGCGEVFVKVGADFHVYESNFQTVHLSVEAVVV